MSIPMVNLKRQYALLQEELEQAVLSSLRAGQFILGSNVQHLEQAVAEYCGVKHAVGVASGTDALHLALLAAGIGPGDEVITTPFTFIGTAEAVSYRGAKPVFVDIDPKTFNLDLNQVEDAITDATRAVLPVHVFGQPVDMDALNALCRPRGVTVIEDCAHAFGARYKNTAAGGLGKFGCFSFYPSKNLSAFGDGGMITTDDDESAATLRALRNHGIRQAPVHSMLGYNSRLDDVQAAIVAVKFRYIDEYNNARRKTAHLYNRLLKDLDVVTPHEDGIGEHVYHQYAILSDHRDKLKDALAAAGIGFGIHYAMPLHKQPVYSQMYQGRSFPNAENACRQVLCLPICPQINEQEVQSVCEVLSAAL